MSEDAPQAPLMTPALQKRWAVFGCFGCMGFITLTVVLALMGFRNSLDPDNVWGQLSAYLKFDSPPAGFAPLFEVSFFDQRQISFYLVADNTQILVQEYSSRVREDFDDAISVDKLREKGAVQVQAGSMELQGHAVPYVTFLGGPANDTGLADAESLRSDLRGRVLDALNMLPDELPQFRTDTPLYQFQFSGKNDAGGTLLSVRAPSPAPLTAADFDALFAPFDLWAYVDSAPAGPSPDELNPELTNPTPTE